MIPQGFCCQSHCKCFREIIWNHDQAHVLTPKTPPPPHTHTHIYTAVYTNKVDIVGMYQI